VAQLKVIRIAELKKFIGERDKMIKKLEEDLTKLELEGVIQSHSQPGSLKIFFKITPVPNLPIKKEPIPALALSPSSYESPLHSAQSPSPSNSATPSSPLPHSTPLASSSLQYSPEGSLSPVKDKPRGKANTRALTPKTEKRKSLTLSRKTNETYKEKTYNRSQEEDSAESLKESKSMKKRQLKVMEEEEEYSESKGRSSSRTTPSGKALKKRKNDGDMEDRLIQVWDTIVKHRHAAIFRYPVTKDEAEDYDEIIDKRMDLETIKSHIHSGEIGSPHDIWNSLSLMFENARVYNGEDSEIAFMADALEKYSRERISKAFPSFLPPDAHSTRKSRSKSSHRRRN